MKKDLNLYLDWILEAIEKINIYTIWMNFNDFKFDWKTSDACIMQFQHIWETSVKIRNIFWDLWLNLDEIIWFRNFISHEYLWIDLETVWDTIEWDLQILKRKILNIKKISK